MSSNQLIYRLHSYVEKKLCFTNSTVVTVEIVIICQSSINVIYTENKRHAIILEYIIPITHINIQFGTFPSWSIITMFVQRT